MSFWEIFVIILVALVVIKPERLPEIAYLLEKSLNRYRLWYHQALDNFKNLM